MVGEMGRAGENLGLAVWHWDVGGGVVPPQGKTCRMNRAGSWGRGLLTTQLKCPSMTSSQEHEHSLMALLDSWCLQGLLPVLSGSLNPLG